MLETRRINQYKCCNLKIKLSFIRIFCFVLLHSTKLSDDSDSKLEVQHFWFMFTFNYSVSLSQLKFCSLQSDFLLRMAWLLHQHEIIQIKLVTLHKAIEFIQIILFCIHNQLLSLPIIIIRIIHSFSFRFFFFLFHFTMCSLAIFHLCCNIFFVLLSLNILFTFSVFFHYFLRYFSPFLFCSGSWFFFLYLNYCWTFVFPWIVLLLLLECNLVIWALIQNQSKEEEKKQTKELNSHPERETREKGLHLSSNKIKRITITRRMNLNSLRCICIV